MENKEFKEDLIFEFNNLQRLVDEMKELLSKISECPSFIEIRSAASILHDFYSGVEKIFKRIALSVDNNLPKGEDWHRELLLQMAKPFGKRKKAIISGKLLEKLKEYLRFRHLFRHIYGFELKWESFKELCNKLGEIFKEFQSEIDGFLKELEEND